MRDTIEHPFEEFEQPFQDPQESGDSLSDERIRNIFSEGPGVPADHVRIVVQRLTGKTFRDSEARDHWQGILRHKEDMQARLGRHVCILVTALDYFDAISGAVMSQRSMAILDRLDPLTGSINREGWANRICEPDHILEKLKEEMLRAKRYSHALSSILLDVEEIGTEDREFMADFGNGLLTVVAKIIRKTIRAVDIVSIYSDNRFLLVLPSTNKREAMELAGRLRSNILERTKRFTSLAGDVTVTLSVEQAVKDDTSIEFIKSLEYKLERGKKKAANIIY